MFERHLLRLVRCLTLQMRIVLLFISVNLLFNCVSNDEVDFFNWEEAEISEWSPQETNQTQFKTDLLLHAQGEEFYSPKG